MRTGIVAILAAMAACLTLSAARAQPDCANWNSGGFFKTAGGEDARACLRTGADPDARDEKGFTPLHIAAHKGHTAAIAALREAGADPGARNKDGQTPFDLIPEYSLLIGTPVYQQLKDARWN